MDTDSEEHIIKSNLYDELYQKGIDIISNIEECKNCPYDYKCCKPMKENCKYLSDNGCIVECLACKLYICKEIKDNYPEIVSKLNKLTDIAKSNDIFKYYKSKEEILNGNVCS